MSFLPKQREELEPGEAGHPVIGDDEVDGAAGQGLQRLRDVVRRDGLMPGSLQRVLEDQPDCRFVVEAENRRHTDEFDARAQESAGSRRYSSKTLCVLPL